MSFSDTSLPGFVGIAVSSGTAHFADELRLFIQTLGFETVLYDLAHSEGGQLEIDASVGKLKLMVELGLGDYLTEILRSGPSSTSRLTGAITGEVPQIWVLYPGAVFTQGTLDSWDIAGRQLAWLASAAKAAHEVIVCQGDDGVDTVAKSLGLWVLSQVIVNRTSKSALLQEVKKAIRRLLQTN